MRERRACAPNAPAATARKAESEPRIHASRCMAGRWEADPWRARPRRPAVRLRARILHEVAGCPPPRVGERHGEMDR